MENRVTLAALVFCAFLTAGGLLYGIARFTNGVLTDRGSARKVMSLGLFVCAAVNVLFGFSDWIAAAWGHTALPTGGPQSSAAAAASLVWTFERR